MTRLGAFAFAHNGNLVNAAELRQKLDDGQTEFTSTTDSELIAFAIQQAVNRGLDGSRSHLLKPPRFVVVPSAL